MGDTRAINIILAGIIIFIVIAGFYVFLTKQVIEKQNDAIKGSAGTIQIDRMIAEWAHENTAILYEKKGVIANSLDAWFTTRGFVVGNILGGNLQHEPPRCEEYNTAIVCNFAITRNKNAYPDQDYRQTVILPTKNGVRTIVLTGKVTYE